MKNNDVLANHSVDEHANKRWRLAIGQDSDLRDVHQTVPLVAAAAGGQGPPPACS